MAVENANIDIIGPLLTLHDVPDIDLVEQVLDVMGGLFKIALQQMIKRASDEELEASRGLIRRLSDSSLSAEQQMQVRMELGRFFMAKSHNLLLRLINNSLRTQFVDHEQSDVLPAADPSEFADPVARLDAAIAARDTDSATRASEEIAAIDRRLILAAIAQAHPQKDTAGATI
jgi:DNA-binding FadR family transcriptional regulator